MMRAAVLSVALCCAAAAAEYKDGYADSNGVKIHYVTAGSGPLIVMVHGFPDFWYSWRHQMQQLSKEYRCVAMDQRAFNLSDKPAGVENYAVEKLVGDVEADGHATTLRAASASMSAGA